MSVQWQVLWSAFFNKGKTLVAAPARATDMLHPRIAFAPRLLLSLVLSSLHRRASIFPCSVQFRLDFTSSGPTESFTLATAFVTPFPPKLLPPSRSSIAS